MTDTAAATTRDGRAVEFADQRPDEGGGGQYEARVDGAVVGLAAYQRTQELMVFTHTETDRSVEGQGVASALVRFALDDVRREGTHKVLAVCPFVVAYLRRHRDEYADLDYMSRTTSVHD